MADIDKIKRNIGKMIDQGAPKEHIDAYLASEGVTADQLKAPQQRPLYAGGKDLAASVGSGLVRGGAMVAGQGGDINKVMEKGIQAAGVKPVAPTDYGPQQPGLTGDELRERARALLPPWMRGNPEKSPDLSSAGIMKKIDAAANKVIPGVGPVAGYKPKSDLGRVGQTAASFVPMAMTTRMGAFRGGVAPGAVSEIAGQHFEGTPYETPARIGGAVLGGSLPTRRTPTQADVRTAATAAYESPAVRDLRIAPGGMEPLAQDVQRLVEQGGLRPYSSNAGPVYRGMDDLANLDRPGGLAVSDVTPFKKIFQNEVESNRDALTGRLNPAGAGANTARRRITDYLANVPPQDVVAGNPQVAGEVLRFGNANYAQAQKMAVAERAMELAERRAATGGSGKNVNNVERQELRKILNNQAQEAGLSADEVAALERAVLGTGFGNMARSIGNQWGGSGLAAPVTTGMAGTAGYYLGGEDPKMAVAAALAARMGGLGARSAANASTARNVRGYENLLAERSPLAQHPEVMQALGIPQNTPQNPSIAALLAAEQAPPPQLPRPVPRITVRPEQYAPEPY